MMKKIRDLLYILVFVVTSVTLFSCGDDKTNPVPVTTYTVEFETFGGEPIPAQTVEEGYYTFPEAKKENEIFDTWCIDVSLSNIFSGQVNSDITLYAKYTKVFKIEFESIEGGVKFYENAYEGELFDLTGYSPDPGCVFSIDGINPYLENTILVESNIKIKQIEAMYTINFELDKYVKFKDEPITTLNGFYDTNNLSDLFEVTNGLELDIIVNGESYINNLGNLHLSDNMTIQVISKQRGECTFHTIDNKYIVVNNGTILLNNGSPEKIYYQSLDQVITEKGYYFFHTIDENLVKYRNFIPYEKNSYKYDAYNQNRFYIYEDEIVIPTLDIDGEYSLRKIPYIMEYGMIKITDGNADFYIEFNSDSPKIIVGNNLTEEDLACNSTADTEESQYYLSVGPFESKRLNFYYKDGFFIHNEEFNGLITNLIMIKGSVEDNNISSLIKELNIPTEPGYYLKSNYGNFYEYINDLQDITLMNSNEQYLIFNRGHTLYGLLNFNTGEVLDGYKNTTDEYEYIMWKNGDSSLVYLNDILYEYPDTVISLPYFIQLMGTDTTVSMSSNSYTYKVYQYNEKLYVLMYDNSVLIRNYEELFESNIAGTFFNDMYGFGYGFKFNGMTLSLINYEEYLFYNSTSTLVDQNGLYRLYDNGISILTYNEGELYGRYLTLSNGGYAIYTEKDPNCNVKIYENGLSENSLTIRNTERRLTLINDKYAYYSWGYDTLSCEFGDYLVFKSLFHEYKELFFKNDLSQSIVFIGYDVNISNSNEITTLECEDGIVYRVGNYLCARMNGYIQKEEDGYLYISRQLDEEALYIYKVNENKLTYLGYIEGNKVVYESKVVYYYKNGKIYEITDLGNGVKVVYDNDIIIAGNVYEDGTTSDSFREGLFYNDNDTLICLSSIEALMDGYILYKNSINNTITYYLYNKAIKTITKFSSQLEVNYYFAKEIKVNDITIQIIGGSYETQLNGKVYNGVLWYNISNSKFENIIVINSDDSKLQIEIDYSQIF